MAASDQEVGTTQMMQDKITQCWALSEDLGIYKCCWSSYQQAVLIALLLCFLVSQLYILLLVFNVTAAVWGIGVWVELLHRVGLTLTPALWAASPDTQWLMSLSLPWSLKTTHAPFRRIREEEIEVDPRFADNSFEAKVSFKSIVIRYLNRQCRTHNGLLLLAAH